MRFLLLPLLTMVLFQTVAAQTTPSIPAIPKKLFWSEAPECGVKNASITSEDKFTCSLLIEDDWKLHRFEYNGLILTVKFFPLGEYFVANVDLVNKTGEVKAFNVQDWMVVYFENKEAFNAGQKPLSGANPTKEPVVNVLSNVRTTETSNDDITDLGRTILTRERGESVIRTTPAPPRPQNSPGSTTTSTVTRTVKVPMKLKTLTGDKTIPANKKISGTVYFTLEQGSDFCFVSLNIDGVFYVFPVPTQKSK